ncbi:hypothetical protein ACFL55_03260 [Candidatus Latescibacterota bacterium]
MNRVTTKHLYSDIIASVERILEAHGEDPAHYDIGAIVAPTPLEHGAIVRDYQQMRSNGASTKEILEKLGVQYAPLKVESIRSIIKRRRRDI